MSKKLFLKGIFAAILSIVIATIFSGDASYAEAVTTRGLFTDVNDVRWEWQKTIDSSNETEPESVSIMFYDKPAATTEIVVPSLNDVIAAAGASASLNTYYVVNADTSSQDSYFTSETRRESTANVTKLDMANTSKVQIRGVSPIIDAETEVELVFGENMVIGDKLVDAGWYTYYVGGAFAGYHLKLTNFNEFNYVGLNAFKGATFNEANTTITINGEGFKGVDIFAETNIKKVILNTNTTGEGIFRDCAELTEIEFGDNVTTIGSNAFYGTNLGSLDFSNTNVKTISESAFENAGITELNLGGIVNLWFESFRGNQLTELYLPKSIEFLGTRVFQDNNIRKVTVAYDTMTFGTILPFWQVMNGDSNGIGTYYSNGGQPIEELNIIAPYGPNESVGVTHISYDEYKWGHTCWNNYYDRGGHISYPDVGQYDKPCPVEGNSGSYAYNGGFSMYGGSGTSYGEIDEQKFVDIRNMKNVIAPTYFAHLHHLKRINIGDGFEFIGDYAFLDTSYMVDGNGMSTGAKWADVLENGVTSGTYYGPTKVMESISLPDSLKGVGNLAFNAVTGLDFEMTIPNTLEYIGVAAFRNFAMLKLDFSFPNLKFLGDHAFAGTQVHNIVLNDKLQYVGFGAFSNCFFINDITIDYDLFNPQKNEYYNRTGGSYIGDTDSNFMTFFGPTYAGAVSSEEQAEQIGMNADILYAESGAYQRSNGREVYVRERAHPVMKYGTVTFTEKAQAEYPTWRYATAYNKNKAYFGFMSAEKLDLSQTGWKKIPLFFFTSAQFGELLLPAGLTEIQESAFNGTVIQNELILPDSIINIANEAFNQDKISFYNRLSGDNKPTITIKKLPSSLQYVGDAAFYNDFNLETDFDVQNIVSIGQNAFSRTKLANIVLHDKITSIKSGAFSPIKAIQDITIDCDFYNVVASYDPFYVTFSKVEWDSDYMTPGQASGQWMNGEQNTFGSVTFTEKAITKPTNYGAFFSDFIFNKFDISRTPWETIPSEYAFVRTQFGELLLPNVLETIPVGFLFETTVEKPVTLPESVKVISSYAFQQAKMNIINGLHEGIENINYGAFYAADCFEDLVIPNSVVSIQPSAFNAGDSDAYYKTVVIKPAVFNYSKTSGQAIFQLFYNAIIDKLIIDSETLPTMTAMEKDESGKYISDSGTIVCVNSEDNYDFRTSTCHNASGEETPTKRMPEFHGMTMKEVVLNNADAITANAFEENAFLEKVDLSQNSNLQYIGRYAFLNSDKLAKVVFGNSLEGKDVAIGEYAFKNTGIETIGIDGNAGFNLAAANFGTQITHRDVDSGEVVAETDSHAFAEMPVLRSVSVPASFSNKTIPAYTFADDSELAEATIAWEVEAIDDGTFVGDHKLKKLFIWGDTNIIESDEFVTATSEVTIPEETTIYGYSDAPSEAYANAASRDDYEGKFYALDEVLYLATNKSYVILNDDKDDFDKEGLTLYALRRDGVILESDNWQQYTTAYPRTTANINFEEGRGALGDDNADAAGIVYDAPKPFNVISLANENYANVDFEFVTMPSNNNPLVLINYPDGYTGNIRTATLISMTKEEEEEMLRELEVPNTGVFLSIVRTATPAVSISAIIVMGGLYIAKKRKN